MHIAEGDLCKKAILSKWQVQHPGTETCQVQMTTAYLNKTTPDPGLFSWGWCELQLLLLVWVTDAVAVGQPP